jgi:RHS repeat-associated protein
MQSKREMLLCHYRYDPLDRLSAYTPSAQSSTRRYYLKDRLATEIQGSVQRSIMQHDDQLLAQQQRQGDTVETRLLATDRQRSVLSMLNANTPCPLAYAPYGHRPLGNGLLSLLGFNGERSDPMTGHYLLGNGYRAFNPVLMRFNSPDSWSPFGEGGLNAYAYCVGDPVNQTDPTGHFSFFPKGYNPFKGLRNILRPKASSTSEAASVAQPAIHTTNNTALNLGNEYELVGYHGTSAEHAKSMQVTGLWQWILFDTRHTQGAQVR